MNILQSINKIFYYKVLVYFFVITPSHSFCFPSFSMEKYLRMGNFNSASILTNLVK